VCSDRHLPRSSIADVLDRLVDTSHVYRDQNAEVRYGFLDVTRAYARDLLEASAEAAALSASHARWCLRIGEQIPPEHLDATHAARLKRSEDNLRAALTWAVESGAAQLGLRLASAAFVLWYFGGHYAEGRAWLERALGLEVSGVPPLVVARARSFLGQILALQGEYAAAEAHLEAALARRRSRATAASSLALVTRANVARMRGEIGAARDLYDEALPTVRRLGSQLEEVALLQLARIAREQGDIDRAHELTRELAEIGEARAKPLVTARAHYLRGLLSADAGNLRRARQMLEAAMAIHRQIGDGQGLADTQVARGEVLVESGRVERALAALLEAATIAARAGDRTRLFEALEGIARAAAASEPHDTVRLASALTSQRKAVGAARWPLAARSLEGALATARATLGDRDYRLAWDAGQHMTEQAALALGLALAAQPQAARQASARASDSVLTPREQEVVTLLARGLSTRQMAATLVISLGTMRTHVDHIRRKLGVHTRAQVVAWAAHNLQL
jgi:ATP/maltotriose-dependent transcriptional regulator MalT